MNEYKKVSIGKVRPAADGTVLLFGVHITAAGITDPLFCRAGDNGEQGAEKSKTQTADTQNRREKEKSDIIAPGQVNVFGVCGVIADGMVGAGGIVARLKLHFPFAR